MRSLGKVSTYRSLLGWLVCYVNRFSRNGAPPTQVVYIALFSQSLQMVARKQHFCLQILGSICSILTIWHQWIFTSYLKYFKCRYYCVSQNANLLYFPSCFGVTLASFYYWPHCCCSVQKRPQRKVLNTTSVRSLSLYSLSLTRDMQPSPTKRRRHS